MYVWEVIGYSDNPSKDSPLAYRTFAKVKAKLDDIILFNMGRRF